MGSRGEGVKGELGEGRTGGREEWGEGGKEERWVRREREREDDGVTEEEGEER